MARTRKPAKKSKPLKSKTLMDVFTNDPRPVVPVLDTPPPPSAAAVMLAEVEQELDLCPFCGRWNSRTRGHRQGCKLGEFLGRVAA